MTSFIYLNSFLKKLFKYVLNYINYMTTEYIQEVLINWGVLGLSVASYDGLYKLTYALFNKISTKFSNLDNLKKQYIVTNINKSALLSIISVLFMAIIYKNPSHINPLHIVSTKERLVWKNVTALYASTDIVGLIRNKRMALSTKIHHYGVVLAFIIISVSKFNPGSLSKALVLYGSLSSLAFCVNLYLGARFFFNKDSKHILRLKKLAKYSYMAACILNWTWQSSYIKNTYLTQESLQTINRFQILKFVINSGLLYAWISDDIKLITHLSKD